MAFTIRRKEGEELHFGKGDGSSLVEAPCPAFCNLKLAVARVLYASGAFEVIDRFEEDMDGLAGEPMYFGSPNFSDELLLDRIHSAVAVL